MHRRLGGRLELPAVAQFGHERRQSFNPPAARFTTESDPFFGEGPRHLDHGHHLTGGQRAVAITKAAPSPMEGACARKQTTGLAFATERLKTRLLEAVTLLVATQRLRMPEWVW